METEIIIKGFDNGITLQMFKAGEFPMSRVILDDDCEGEIGELVWAMIGEVLDGETDETVKIKIEKVDA